MASKTRHRLRSRCTQSTYPSQVIIMRTSRNYCRPKSLLNGFTFKEIREANEQERKRAVDRIYDSAEKVLKKHRR